MGQKATPGWCYVRLNRWKPQAVWPSFVSVMWPVPVTARPPPFPEAGKQYALVMQRDVMIILRWCENVLCWHCCEPSVSIERKFICHCHVLFAKLDSWERFVLCLLTTGPDWRSFLLQENWWRTTSEEERSRWKWVSDVAKKNNKTTRTTTFGFEVHPRMGTFKRFESWSLLSLRCPL